MRCFRLVQQSLESDHSLFGLTVTAINYVDRARCLERRYRRSRDTIDRLAWIGQLRALHHLYRQKEAAYWEDLVTKNSANPKRLWSTISVLLGKSSSTSPSPSFSADDYQCYRPNWTNYVRLQLLCHLRHLFLQMRCLIIFV